MEEQNVLYLPLIQCCGNASFVPAPRIHANNPNNPPVCLPFAPNLMDATASPKIFSLQPVQPHINYLTWATAWQQGPCEPYSCMWAARKLAPMNRRTMLLYYE
jgi:hypothetical protein